MKRNIFLIVLSFFLLGSMYAQQNHWIPVGVTGNASLTIWGEVTIDGVSQTSNDIEVAMFFDGTCRDSKRVMGYYGNNFYRVQLTGQFEGAGHTVTFKCYDHATGTEFNACPYTYTTDASTHVEGNAMNPVQLAFTSPSGPSYPWIPVQSQDNAYIIAIVQINGVTITDGNNWDVGAFCGDVCRGLNGWVPGVDLPYENYLMMMLYGAEGDELSFYLYDKVAGAVHPGVCDYTVTWTANGGWGDFWNPVILNFVTPYIFTGATNTNWDLASNWEGNEIPGEGATVIIDGICELEVDANVASLTVNEGKSITVLDGKTLTADAITTADASQLVIADGGQLFGNVEGVLATVQREIAGYGSDDNVTNGWNFISSPLEGSIAHTEVVNLTDNQYDLYAFDQTGGDDNLEWRNFKLEGNALTLNSGIGYLYGNSDDVTLNFAGELNSSVSSVELSNVSGYVFSGWNLIGNPFTYNVYIDKSHYVMEEGVLNPNPVMASTAIAPCTGVLVVGDAEETVAFSQTAPDAKSQGYLHMMLSQPDRRGAMSDHAILSFNQGDELTKFHFSGNAMLCFPKEGKDYAILTAETCGEVPVCFTANENGSYRLSFNTEDVTFGYLHLIDNMTGADVDLLETPSYSFEAKTTDYANRFKLVFTTGHAADDSIAFLSNGGWVINNDGQATLQVVDMTGRVLSSENINGCCFKNLSVASGVYMLRLINGDSVNVQKIMVK